MKRTLVFFHITPLDLAGLIDLVGAVVGVCIYVRIRDVYDRFF
jgi:hypothetical protein